MKNSDNLSIHYLFTDKLQIWSMSVAAYCLPIVILLYSRGQAEAAGIVMVLAVLFAIGRLIVVLGKRRKAAPATASGSRIDAVERGIPMARAMAYVGLLAVIMAPQNDRFMWVVFCVVFALILVCWTVTVFAGPRKLDN